MMGGVRIIMNTNFKVWLNDYIEQMEYEVEENTKEGYYVSESNGELECPEDYYDLGVGHGEQQGVLSTLRLIKGKLGEVL